MHTNWNIYNMVQDNNYCKKAFAEKSKDIIINSINQNLNILINNNIIIKKLGYFKESGKFLFKLPFKIWIINKYIF